MLIKISIKCIYNKLGNWKRIGGNILKRLLQQSRLRETEDLIHRIRNRSGKLGTEDRFFPLFINFHLLKWQCKVGERETGKERQECFIPSFTSQMSVKPQLGWNEHRG